MRGRKTMLGKGGGALPVWKRLSASVRATAGRFFAKKHPSRGQASHEASFDARRRAFLKYAAFGSVLFVAGKYADPIINTLRGDTVLSEKTFENFKVTETGRQLQVTDDDGEEILTIDKEGF